MKTLSVRTINPAVEREVVEMLRKGLDMEQVIVRMRTSGLNKIESMKILRTHAGIDLAAAKEAVHLSEAWADRRGPDDALHEVAINTVSQVDRV